MLLDSNIIIYSIQPDYSDLRTWILRHNISVSLITQIEVLGYHKLIAADKNDFETLFSYTTVFPINQTIVEKTIELRQQRKMSVGDAIIAATALIHKKTLGASQRIEVVARESCFESDFSII